MSPLVAVARALLRVSMGPDVAGRSVLGDLEEEHRRRPAGLARDAAYIAGAMRLVVGYGLWRRMRRRLLRAASRPRMRPAGLALDLRQAARSLRRRPTYLIAGAVTLALGIGADTAIFSVVWHSLLRPLPYPAAARTLVLFDHPLDRPDAQSNMNVANFLELRERTRAFDALSAFEYGSFLVGGSGDPASVRGLRVNAGFFLLLGLPPQLGRDFREEDDRPGATPVVILSDGLWRERFGADAAIVGRTISIDLVPHVVVGIAAPAMEWRAQPRLWKPWAWDAATRADRRRRSIFAVGRLAPGVAPAVGRAELAALFADIRRRHPEPNEGRTVSGTDLTEWTVGWGRRFMSVLSGAAALVLLIACVNVAGLMLARASGRRAELAMRRALGAGRFRAGSVFLSEALLLSALGTVLGLLVAFGGVQLILALWGGSIPRAEGVAVSGATLLFACAAALGSALLVGLTPALLTDSGTAGHLRAAGRGAGTRGGRVHSVLVIVEVALAVVLVAAAGLLGNTALRLARVDLGVDEGAALSFRVTLPPVRYATTAQSLAFFRSMVAGIESIPGVAAVGLSSRDPLSGGTNGTFATRDRPDREHILEMRAVTPAWLAATGQRLLEGRMLTDEDRRSDAVLVNGALARSLFPGGSAVGRALRSADGDGAWTIAGVVSDVRDFGPAAEPRPTLYWAFGGDVLSSRSMAVLVRTDGRDPATLLPVIRERIRLLDADLPLSDPVTLETLARRTLGRERTASLVLIGAFGVLALVLAVVGIYAVIAFTVEERRREVGVRMALGATSGGILRMVCLRGLRLAGIGIALGLAGAALGGRFVAHLLWRVDPLDPLTLGATAALFCAVATVASLLPARRAAGFDVADVLREN